MTQAPPNPAPSNQIVVAFLDGRRLKGYCFNFSPLRSHFDLFPDEKSPRRQGTRVRLRDVKAVFFVKNFAGNSAYVEDQAAEFRSSSKTMEITFADGEKIVGTSMTYNSEKLGFFLAPSDPKSNNARVFVVNQHAKQVRELRAPAASSVSPPASK